MKITPIHCLLIGWGILLICLTIPSGIDKSLAPFGYSFLLCTSLLGSILSVKFATKKRFLVLNLISFTFAALISYLLSIGFMTGVN